jgi:chromosome segregation ATPase
MAAPIAANAQGWLSMNQRQAALDARIDAGVRSGALTNSEATGLRADFNGIARLEADYRRSAPGLTQAELQDLDRRFDVLSDRIAQQVADNDRRGDGRGDDRWDNRGGFDQRLADLERRIDQGVRSGQLTRTEAADLRRQADALDRLEDQYRTGGLTPTERADLDRRFDQMAANLHDSRSDRDRTWDNIQALRAQLDRRIDRATRDNRLSSREARRLHNDTAALVRLEAQYRASRPGVTRAEMAELNRRMDSIESRIGDNINIGYGYGNAR